MILLTTFELDKQYNKTSTKATETSILISQTSYYRHHRSDSTAGINVTMLYKLLQKHQSLNIMLIMVMARVIKS